MKDGDQLDVPGAGAGQRQFTYSAKDDPNARRWWLRCGVRMKARFGLTGITFGVLLSLFMVAPAIFGGRAAWQQWQTRRYVEVRGTISRSSLTSDESELGTSYGLDVGYTYTVDGRSLTGTVLKHDGGGDRQHFETLRARFPLGAQVPVYIDALAPERAVLIRGEVEGPFLSFAMTFLALMFAGWGFAWEAARGDYFDAPGARPLRRWRGVLRVSLMEYRAGFAAGLWGALCLVACFAELAIYGRADSAGTLMFLGLQLSAAPTAYLFVRAWERRLLVDDRAQTLSIRTFRGEIANARFDVVRSLWVRERSYRQDNWERKIDFVPTIEVEHAGGLRRIGLGALSSEQRAEGLRAWLAVRLAPNTSASKPAPPQSARTAEERARMLGLPRAWRAPRDWVKLALLASFALPAVCVMAVYAVMIMLGYWPGLKDLRLLAPAALGLSTVRPCWRRAVGLVRGGASVVYIEADGIGWDYGWREQRRPARAELSLVQGFAPFKSIAVVRYGCGDAADEIDLHLKDNQVFTLPRSVTAGPAKHELVELLEDEFPDLTLVECENPRRRR